MGYVTINFNDVDSFEPLPGDEWYGVEIDKVEVRENKDGDALYLNWELVVVDGDYENRRLWMITSLKETALFRLKQTFEELGVIDDDEEIEIEYDDDMEPTTKSGPHLIYPELEGLEASVYVKNQMYDGREQNRVTELRGEKPRKKSRSVSRDNGASSSRSRSNRTRDAAPAHKSRNTGRRASRDDYDDDEDDDDEDEVRPQRRPAKSRQGGRRRIR